MSLKAYSWAWGQPISGNRKLVLLVLADHHRVEDGDAVQPFPKIKTIERYAGCGRTAVKSALRELEAAGLVRVEERYVDGRQVQSRYHLPCEEEGGRFPTPSESRPVGGRTPTGGGSDSDPSGGHTSDHQEPVVEPVVEPEEEPDAVWTYWVERRRPSRQVMPVGTQRQLARARKAGYTDAQLCSAIDALLASDWHRERKLLTLSTIFATKPSGKTFEDQVDDWIARGAEAASTAQRGSINSARADELMRDVRRHYTFPDDQAKARAKDRAVDELARMGIEVGWNARTNQPTFREVGS